MTGKSYYFREVRPGDAEAFAGEMREADRRELRRWGGNSPLYELRRAVELSDALWVGCLADGTMLSMFGGKEDNPVEGTGVVWELSAVGADRHRTLFARRSREGMLMVFRALPRVERFYNYVDCEYEAAVRWIEWLGGRVSDGGGFRGMCGGLFKRFEFANPFYREG